MVISSYVSADTAASQRRMAEMLEGVRRDEMESR